MRRLVLLLAAIVLIPSGAVHAQTVLGTWQGTLPIDKNPRIVLKIIKGNAGSLRGVFFWIDVEASSIPFSTVTFVAPDLSATTDMVGVSYQGKLSADGNSITGIWIQDKQSYPLTVTLTTPETVWKHQSAVAAEPMAANADPSFEVATIKPSQPDAKQQSFHLRSRQFTAKNTTVAYLIQYAYHVRARQIEGAPDWTKQLKVDIVAEPDTAGVPNEDQDRIMIRKLLADRFQLKFHTIRKTFPVYALTWPKDSSKLIQSDPSEGDHSRIVQGYDADGQTVAQFVYSTMPNLADLLMNFIQDRQIVDETGLTGQFDFKFEIPTNVLQGSDDNEKAAAFIEAIRPLGFKLVSKKAPLQVLVIDHLEKPSAN